MQSPPASADATSVIILSLVFARPGASPRSRRCRTSSGRPRCRARVAGRSSPALATKRRSSKVIWIRSGWLRGSIYWVLLFRGRFFATKPLSQKHRSTFLPLQDANPTPSFGGFGLSHLSEFWGPPHIRRLGWKRQMGDGLLATGASLRTRSSARAHQPTASEEKESLLTIRRQGAASPQSSVSSSNGLNPTAR